MKLLLPSLHLLNSHRRKLCNKENFSLVERVHLNIQKSLYPKSYSSRKSSMRNDEENMVIRNKYKLNIIVVSDKKEEGKNVLFDKVKSQVDGEKFVVYNLSSQALEKSSSWMTGCRAIIMQKEVENALLQESIEQFQNSGGLVICATDKERLVEQLALFSSKETEEWQDSLASIFSQGFLYSDPDTVNLLNCDRILARKKNNVLTQGKVDLILAGDGSCDTVEKANESKEFFHLEDFSDKANFNVENYLAKLETKTLGRNIISLPSVSSSMNVVSGLPLVDGLVIVPDRQTAGEGRGGNRWISPEGCAMCTLQLHLTLGRGIGRTPSLLQHVVGLAVIKALGDDLDIRLKWPNDIYYKKEAKLGGVVVNSSMFSSNLIINIGCGLNLSNQKPTLSVNQLRREAGLSEVSREQYLAATLNYLEDFLRRFDDGRAQEVIQEYHKVWLHTNQQVEIHDGVCGEEPQPVRILGLDEYGYLLVQDQHGRQFSVHDDGNSFDMLNGLIRPKFS
eukprot:TRINITY_DN31776_c0_g1_i1.p1 TRINITY_DN31776_c0_g1~~TRINITY_DN31776_c0_g1_i1.p1  ORF type:complete len:507 (+),score=78.12 TRINITY_DN31776_c0_g1_i1:46-1566(+)